LTSAADAWLSPNSPFGMGYAKASNRRDLNMTRIDRVIGLGENANLSGTNDGTNPHPSA
jgi:hypothetical protein